jgi:hypothetical protein
LHQRSSLQQRGKFRLMAACREVTTQPTCGVVVITSRASTIVG